MPKEKNRAKSKAKFSQVQRHFLLSSVLRDNKGKHQTLANVPSIDLSLQEKVTAAEAPWAMKTAGSDYSFSSSDGTLELFRKMFPCDVSNNFSMSRTKVS